jgi:hypothetical protein
VDKSKAKEITIEMKQKTEEERLKEEQEAKEENITNEFWNNLEDLDKQKNGSKREIYTTDNPTVEKLNNQITVTLEMISPDLPPEPITEKYEYLKEYEEDEVESQTI